jgi:hypothetical protein
LSTRGTERDRLAAHALPAPASVAVLVASQELQMARVPLSPQAATNAAMADGAQASWFGTGTGAVRGVKGAVDGVHAR